jgi:hypothetical protein
MFGVQVVGISEWWFLTTVINIVDARKRFGGVAGHFAGRWDVVEVRRAPAVLLRWMEI